MPAGKKERSPRDKFIHTRVFLWRHPEVQGQADGKFWGQTDVAMTKLGKSQMKSVVNRMAGEKLAAIYCSNLRRTSELADAVGKSYKPRLKAEAVPDLCEMDLGKWEGMTYREINRKYPGALTARSKDLVNYRIEGGESLADLAERVVPAFRKLVDKNQGKQICIISHAGVNRVILTKVLGAPLDNLFRLEQEHACLNIIDVYEDGLPLLKTMNSIFY